MRYLRFSSKILGTISCKRPSRNSDEISAVPKGKRKRLSVSDNVILGGGGGMSSGFGVGPDAGPDCGPDNRLAKSSAANKNTIASIKSNMLRNGCWLVSWTPSDRLRIGPPCSYAGKRPSGFGLRERLHHDLPK